MDSQFVWTCPQCGRAVPKRVSSCRCGHRLAAGDAQVSAPPAAQATIPIQPAVRSSRIPILIAAGVAVIAAAVGVVSWRGGRTQAAPVVPATPLPAALTAAAATATSAPGGIIEKEPPPVATKFETAEAPATVPIEELVSRSMPAVVTVETHRGLGSGFFVSADTVLTNKHVVESEESVTLRVAGGRTIAARVDSSSWDFDLAVLKVSVADPAQVFLPLALASDVRVGAEVIAIGSPVGLRNTVTRGIVSGTREFQGISVVQTDAAINPGNSGGPLIDREGRVIGVNTLKLAGLALQSIGFAVSVSYVRRMLGPEFGLKAERELQRQQDLTRYEKAVASLASRADEVEGRWKGFRSSCFADPDATTPSEREWFALADGRSFQLHDVARCKSWRDYFAESAARVRDGLKDVEGRATMSGLPVELTRRIRHKYKMFWPDWDR